MNMDGSEQTHPNKAFKKTDTYEDQWVTIEGGNDLMYSTSTESISIGESSGSNGSLSSSDMVDDATSSSSSHGPLYELSEIIAQLPIKRGLSKYYQGKSQTFASLDCVKSLEDLAKKDRPYKKKIKSSKSYGGLNTRIMFRPEAIISKKTSRPCSFSSLGAWNWANCSVGGTKKPGFRLC